jgi:hypothetical protein
VNFIIGRGVQMLKIVGPDTFVMFGDVFALAVEGAMGEGALSWAVTAGQNVATIDAEGNVTITLKVAKYNSNASDIKLFIDILDAAGKVVATDVVSAVGIVEFKASVDDKFSVRFSTDAGNDNKRVLLDDISVTVELPYTKVFVENYKTSQNSYMFEDMEQGAYAYRVKALSGTSESAFSEFVKVALSATTVVETPMLDDYVVIYAISGVKVYEGKMSDLHNMSSGIYIIKSSVGVKKIKIE